MIKTVSLSMKELTPVITQCISNGSEVILTVTGNSMRPFLKDKRDQVVLVSADAQNLKVGDVPLYKRRNGKYVLHRLVGVNNGHYTMLGDAQVKEEHGIMPDQIIAISRAFIRKGKRYECSSLQYKRYVRIWNSILPLRKIYFYFKNFAIRAYNKLKRILNLSK